MEAQRVECPEAHGPRWWYQDSSPGVSLDRMLPILHYSTSVPEGQVKSDVKQAADIQV